MGRHTFVSFADDPGWCVAYAEVEDFARLDHLVKGLHEFWDLGRMLVHGCLWHLCEL